MKLPVIKSRNFDKIGYGKLVSEIFAYVTDRASDFVIPFPFQFTVSVGTNGSDDANDVAVPVQERILVGQVSIGQPLVVEYQFKNIEFRRLAFDYQTVIPSEMLRQAGGEQIKIAFSEQLFLARQAQQRSF